MTGPLKKDLEKAYNEAANALHLFSRYAHRANQIINEAIKAIEKQLDQTEVLTILEDGKTRLEELVQKEMEVSA